ncbi:MAG TPA: hypothetical protein PLX89_17545 [Verrucomicrobiota bacterium]|nr:hypothetical protein [Verrucomicrobiales bacterium]HRI14804.1 hypothetical protein [Verrucomicrobiota bacterium]
MKQFINIVVCTITLLALAACSSVESRSQKLQLGMTRAAAVKVLGSDYTVVAARVDPDGSPVSVLKYRGDKKQDLFLYFRKDKLVQWGDTEALQNMPETSPPSR